jgi:acyl-CoA synthetase (AMP-forming)/AMP-acid ligase II
MDSEAVGVFEAFRRGCESFPERPLYTVVDDAGNDKRHLTAGQARSASDAVAGFLQRDCGLEPGDRVVLAYTPSMEFVTAFLGCLRARVVPVPVPPPNPSGRNGDTTVRRFAAMCEAVGAKAVLANREYMRWRLLGQTLRALRRNRPQWPPLPWYTTDGADACARTPSDWVEPSLDEIAYVQFTSGTTGDEPKAIAITHGNLRHQLAMNAHTLGLDPEVRAVLWVPHFHELCLISGILSALSGNGHLYLISPLAFLKRPAVWFEVMSRVGATHTAVPNLALEIGVRKTTAEQRRGWNLSALRILMTAAEPIRRSTVRAFYDAFAASGLREESFCPGYGLAEHSALVTGRGRVTVRVDRASLERQGVVRVAADAARSDTAVYIGCGKPVDGVVVKIVDPETRQPVADGHEGEIWVSSPSKGAGYLGRPAGGDDDFRARLDDPSDTTEYLRTADLGFLFRGELFFTGRAADVIRLSGRTLYPHHLEDTVRDSHALVRPGCVVATIAHENGRPGLAILLEVRTTRLSALQARGIAESVRRTVFAEHQEPCAVVWLGRPGSIPKTTSGKLMRARCRDLARGLADIPGTLHVSTGTARAPEPRFGPRMNVLRNVRLS